MAIISDKLNKILSAVFGKDVRRALHDGLDAINKETESTTARQNYLDRKYDEQIKNMTLQDPSSAEIVDMRVAANGKTFKKAGDRLNYFDEQLDNIPNQTYITEKAKQIDLNTTNGKVMALEANTATKLELEVERKRIDSFTSLPSDSTTGDAELMDGRVGADGVTYKNIGESIRNQIKNIYNEINYETELDYSDKIVKGKFIDKNGLEVALEEYNYVKKINVHGLYSVTLKNVGTNGNACVISHDLNGNVIEKINTSNWTPSTETIVLAKNVYYISISYSKNYPLTITGRGIKYIVFNNENKVNSIINDIFEFPLQTPVKYKRVNSVGKVVASSTDSKVISYIPIKPNTIITLENIMTLNANGYCYAYYDKNFKFIKIGTDKNWETVTITETTPNDAYYVSITYKDGNVPRVYTKDLTVYKNINDYSLDKYKNTTIIWIDDDSDKVGIEYVYSACINKGVNATLACLSKKISEDTTLKTRLLEMEEQGLEMALHGYTHENSIWSNDNFDSKSIISNITKGYREMKDFQNYRHLVTPNGANSDMIKSIAKRFSPCLVSAWEGVNKKEWGDKARYDLGRYWMTNHTLEEFKTVIDGLRPKNDLLILATHSAPSVAPWDAEKIEAMLQYVKDSGYNIVTLSEGIKYFFDL